MNWRSPFTILRASSFRLEVTVFSTAASYATCSSRHGEEGTVHFDSPSQVPRISAVPSTGLDCAGTEAPLKRKMPARKPALPERKAKRTTDFREIGRASCRERV